MNISDVISVVRTKAREMGVDEDLAVAIAMQESGCLWPKASARYEPAFKYLLKVEEFAELNGISAETEKREQMTSWGVLHVMGAVARELGFQGPLPQLFQVSPGVHYGIMKLKKICDTYENELSVIAAYNAGSARKFPGGKYTNQSYVDAVASRLKLLRKVSLPNS